MSSMPLPRPRRLSTKIVAVRLHNRRPLTAFATSMTRLTRVLVPTAGAILSQNLKKFIVRLLRYRSDGCFGAFHGGGFPEVSVAGMAKAVVSRPTESAMITGFGKDHDRM